MKSSLNGGSSYQPLTRLVKPQSHQKSDSLNSHFEFLMKQAENLTQRYINKLDQRLREDSVKTDNENVLDEYS